MSGGGWCCFKGISSSARELVEQMRYEMLGSLGNVVELGWLGKK
jgi:hypothetical protein